MIKSSGDIVQFVELLPDLIPSIIRLIPVIQDANSSPLGTEEETGVQGHSHLYSEFKTSLHL